MLYLPLDTPPRAVFSVHTRGSALTISYNISVLLQAIYKPRHVCDLRENRPSNISRKYHFENYIKQPAACS